MKIFKVRFNFEKYESIIYIYPSSMYHYASFHMNINIYKIGSKRQMLTVAFYANTKLETSEQENAPMKMINEMK